MNKTSVNNNKTIYYHGTKADLKKGDLIKIGYHSNYGKKSKFCIFFCYNGGSSLGSRTCTRRYVR